MKTLAFAICLLTVLTVHAAPSDATTNQPPVLQPADQKEYAAGQAAATGDLAKNLIRYEIVGEPSAIDQELQEAARKQYDITVVFHGCIPGPRVDYDQGYQDAVVAHLKKKYAFDPVAQLERDLQDKKNQTATKKPTVAGALDAAKVLVIARAAVATNDTWIDQAEFETPKQQTNGVWTVLVWRLPKTPGGHRLISIDESGRVTDYFRGR